MKVRRRSDVMQDAVSVDQCGRHVHIFTHRQKIVFSVGTKADPFQAMIERSFDELFEMVEKLSEAEMPGADVPKDLGQRPEGKSGGDKVESASRNAKRGQGPENEREDK